MTVYYTKPVLDSWLMCWWHVTITNHTWWWEHTQWRDPKILSEASLYLQYFWRIRNCKESFLQLQYNYKFQSNINHFHTAIDTQCICIKMCGMHHLNPLPSCLPLIPQKTHFHLLLNLSKKFWCIIWSPLKQETT